MDDFEIKISEAKQPLSLAVVEVLSLTEVHQVFVVSEHLDREGGSMETVSPGLEGVNDCEKLPVIDVIVSLSQGKELGEGGARMPIAICVGLEKDWT